MSKAAYLEAHEPMPDDLGSWLEGWGFDMTKPYRQERDRDGWWWWFQDEEVPDND